MNVVYFVQAGEGGPIKIGTTNNLASRLSKMQTDSAVRLLLRASVEGGKDLESIYHHEFAAHRSAGEWFLPAPEIERRMAEVGLCPDPVWDKPAKSPFHAWRLRNKLRAIQVAARLGISKAHMSEIERGVDFPSFNTMEAIFRLTDGEVTPNDFAPWLLTKSEAA